MAEMVQQQKRKQKQTFHTLALMDDGEQPQQLPA